MSENIYTQGCADKAVSVFKDQFMWIAVGCIVLAVLQVSAVSCDYIDTISK